MTTVIVHGPSNHEPHRIGEQHEDGSLLPHPVPERSVADVLEERDLRPMSSKEFERAFGHMPTDQEGQRMTTSAADSPRRPLVFDEQCRADDPRRVGDQGLLLGRTTACPRRRTAASRRTHRVVFDDA